MTATRLTLRAREADAQALRASFAAIRAEFEVPGGFPAAVLAEARGCARSLVTHPDVVDADFFTLDPPGSMDLDQAVCVERDGDGHRVRYAIADVPSFVSPGGAMDAEARARGETVYLPDGRAPLHPVELSEDAASLLPGQTRPVFLWDLRLDARGEVVSTGLRRAMARSRRRWDYQEAQRALDDGSAPEGLTLLAQVGARRARVEAARGGASLAKPEQEVLVDGGTCRLRFRPNAPIEEHNAQISVMTGMAAAQLMLAGGVGLLRTMPAPDAAAVARFRRQAEAVGAPWPAGLRYGDFLRGLDRANPAHLALVHQAAALFRGAGYTAFDGAAPADPGHAAVAAPYAHVTAPLRRLVDRFALVVCEALTQGRTIPDWARAALPSLPAIMADRGRLAASAQRACADAVEAAVLAPLVGQVLTATVVDARPQGSGPALVLQLDEPAVVAPCDGVARPGDVVRARLTTADVARREIRFEVVGDG